MDTASSEPTPLPELLSAIKSARNLKVITISSLAQTRIVFMDVVRMSKCDAKMVGRCSERRTVPSPVERTLCKTADAIHT